MFDRSLDKTDININLKNLNNKPRVISSVNAKPKPAVRSTVRKEFNKEDFENKIFGNRLYNIESKEINSIKTLNAKPKPAVRSTVRKEFNKEDFENKMFGNRLVWK